VKTKNSAKIGHGCANVWHTATAKSRYWIRTELPPFAGFAVLADPKGVLHGGHAGEDGGVVGGVGDVDKGHEEACFTYL